MLPARRTRSCTTDPCSISNQRERVDLPTTMCVTLCLLREGDHVVGDARAAWRACVTASPPSRSASRRVSAMRSRSSSPSCRLRARLDVERGPRRVQAVGQALGVAHEARGARVLADADQNALARRPRARDGARLHLLEQLLVDALGGAAQRQLAQRGQVGRREVVLERALGLLGDVDLALLQPLDQVVGREVDELDGVGAVEDGSRAPSRARARA